MSTPLAMVLLSCAAVALCCWFAAVQGCGGKIVCPIIRVANELCPVVMVELGDGTQEPVPTGDVVRMATARRAARLAAARDAGADR